MEGPPGAGKSAALLHGLSTERERRGKAGRGHVRILQLWGDEAPSLFARRLVREVGLLNFVPYPQPEKLARLAAEMAQSLPGMSQAGKLLAALVPDDMRPLPTIAAQALAESGARALESGGPLCIGVDLQGGEVSAPVRDFFTRLCDQLPPTVVLLLAHPGGHNSLVQVPAQNRLPAGPFSVEEAVQFLEERLGPLDAASLALLGSGRLSLLPGDLAQIVNLYAFLGRDPQAGLSSVAAYLERDIGARYQMMFESLLMRGEGDPRVLDLCGWCAVTARPQEPLTLQRALARMRDRHGDAGLRPVELAQLRLAPLVRALTATATPIAMASTPTATDGAPTGAPPPESRAIGDGERRIGGMDTLGGDLVGWPLLPANAQARDGVLAVLGRHGLLDVYQQGWLEELLSTLRAGLGRESLLAGLQAMSLLVERVPRDPLALGRAVALLAEMETLLWRAGWHRTFAELYDGLLPALWRAGVAPRDVAPKLWFRRARARIQSVDWSSRGRGSVAEVAAAPDGSLTPGEELPLALEELGELLGLSETAVVQARTRLGLSTDGGEVSDWCRQLPIKARQARGYGRVLRLLIAVPGPAGGRATPPPERQEAILRSALDDILIALGYFVAHDEREDLAQTLTILGDAYSARGDADGDRAALHQYDQAVAVAERIVPMPSFSLGVIYRSIAEHHRRHGRPAQASSAFAAARRHLLSSPESRMGTLLASLLP